MKVFGLICIAGAAILGVIAWAYAVYGAPYLGYSIKDFIDVYQRNARTPIFSGFLTMGSFLLAMKTNIIARLKESYDSQQNFDNYRTNNSEKPHDQRAAFYEGLGNLSSAIGWNVIFCLVTALVQMTVGFWPHPVAFAICTGMAGSCLFLLIYLTLILMREHRDWFNTIEAAAQKKVDAPAESSKTDSPAR